MKTNSNPQKQTCRNSRNNDCAKSLEKVFLFFRRLTIFAGSFHKPERNRMKLKIIVISSFFLLLFGAASCTKKGQTASTENQPVPYSGSIPVGNRPVFVTDRSEPARQPVEESPARPVAGEALPSVVFEARETEHVRIVHYDPFEGKDLLSICLDDLARFFCYPYPGNRISNYGMRGRAMHTGVDIKTIPNDTIRAALGGVVRMSKPYSGYGNIVVVRHACGLETAYAHNSKNLVVPNDIVRAGDPIALAGRTGRATTEHLHFEVRIMGEHFDPNLLLDTENRTIQRGNLNLQRQNGRIQVFRSSGTPGQSDGVSVHEVRRGDTLYSISRKYNVTIEALCELNGIRREDILVVGQKLKIR